MLPKDRIAAAMKKRPVDRIPQGELCIDEAVVKSFLGAEKAGFAEQKDLTDMLGLDLICLSPRWNGVSELESPADPEVRFPEEMNDWVTRTELFVLILLDGSFGWGCRLHGFQDFMISLMRGSAQLSALIKRVEQLNCSVARQALDRGAMGFVIADDIAYQRGLMADPEILRRYFFPSLKRQVHEIGSDRVPVIFHSDGNMDEVIGDIVECGFDGLQGLESAAGMDLESVGRQYGEKLCMWGNLDPTYLTSPLGPDVVAAEANSIKAMASQFPGFIFGTSSGLFAGMRPENLAAAFHGKRADLTQRGGPEGYEEPYLM
jgi:uroporphyrinogen decarboxylase